jgi:hypothetical protein
MAAGSFQILPRQGIWDIARGMPSTTDKKFTAVEEKLAELSELGKKFKRLEKEVAVLRKEIKTPKDWKGHGRLPA